MCAQGSESFRIHPNPTESDPQNNLNPMPWTLPMGTRCANFGLHASISILSELGPFSHRPPPHPQAFRRSRHTARPLRSHRTNHGAATPRGLTHFPRSYRSSRRASSPHGLTLFPGCVTVATCACTHVVHMHDRMCTDCFHGMASSIIGCPVVWLTAWLASWFLGQLAAWLPGWLVRWFVACG